MIIPSGDVISHMTNFLDQLCTTDTAQDTHALKGISYTSPMLIRSPSDVSSSLATLPHNENTPLPPELHRDSIGLLPFELVAHIFRDVDLPTVIRSRQVCQKWAVLLSSTNLMQAVLSPWLSSNETFSSRIHGIPMSLSAVAARIDAFSTGRPFSIYTKYRKCDRGRRSTDVVDYDTGHVAYSNGLLAWIDSRLHTINLLNLWTGKTRAWTKACLFGNQAAALLMAVSDTLFAICSSLGTVAVYDHVDIGEFNFELPSTNAQCLVTKGHTVAVLHGMSATVWNAATKTARQVSVNIDIAEEAISRCYGLLFVADENDLRYYQTPGDTKITFTRVPLDDGVQAEEAKGEVRDPNTIGLIEEYPIPAPITDDTPHLSSFGGLLTLCTVQPKVGTVLIGYDISRQCPRYAQIGCGNPHGLFWKDVVYKSHLVSTTEGRSRRLSVADCRGGSESHWKLTSIMARPSSGINSMQRWWPRHMMNTKLLGDEHFLVQAFTDRVVVHCFNKDLRIDYSGMDVYKRLRP